MTPDHANRTKTPGMTEAELLEALRQRGVEPPEEWQVVRWRPFLPRAPSIPDGTPGRPVLRYAPEAVDYMAAIMEIRGGRKTPSAVLGFELWWSGFSVDDARSFIASVLDHGAGDPLAQAPGPYEAADRLERKLRAKRPRGTLYPLLAERVGGDTDALIAGMYALMLLLLGESPVLESTASLADAEDRGEVSPGQALERLFGFHRAGQDEAPDGTKLLSEPIDIPAAFQQLAQAEVFDGDALSTPIHKASDTELALARDDALAFADDFAEFARATEQAYGSDFAGFGIFTLPRKDGEKRFFRAACVLGMLVLRRMLGGAGIDTVKGTIRREIGKARAYNAIVDAFPEYAVYLRHDQEEAISNASPEFVEEMHAKIKTFMAAHPEIEAAIEDT